MHAKAFWFIIRIKKTLEKLAYFFFLQKQLFDLWQSASTWSGDVDTKYTFIEYKFWEQHLQKNKKIKSTKYIMSMLKSPLRWLENKI
jgi:hypothetical protein